MRDFEMLETLDNEFKHAFMQYFSDLGINNLSASDWDGIFTQMRASTEDRIMVYRENKRILGFIMFRSDTFTHWFFEEHVGFIREFWVDASLRSQGIGSELLDTVEAYFLNKQIYTLILTTDSALTFYHNHGFRIDPSIHAKNSDMVLTKHLEPIHIK